MEYLPQWESKFDKALSDMEGINRLPWIGPSYTDSPCKTLILGESVYNWRPKDPTYIETISNPMNLRQLHVDHAINLKKNSRFVRNIERAVYKKKSPSSDEKIQFWNSVAYHNLVGRIMKTSKHRPSYNDYLYGWSVFEGVCNILSPEQIIVYGLERKKIQAFRDHFELGKFEIDIERGDAIGRSLPVTAIVKSPTKEIKVIFIRHPSAFFSWRKWGTFINNQFEMPWVSA